MLHERIVNQHHQHQHHHDGGDSWPSPPDSNSSGDDRLPRIGFAVPSAPWKRPACDQRLGIEFPDPRQTSRRTLVPLIYLESISAPPRQPLDDFAIRAFDSHGV